MDSGGFCSVLLGFYYVRLELQRHVQFHIATPLESYSNYLIGGKIRRGYISSVKIFRRLKVSSNRKKLVTFHRRKHSTNFEISKFFKKYYFRKKIQVHFSYLFIFLFFYNNVHVMSMSIAIIVFSSSWKLYPLVAITSGLRIRIYCNILSFVLKTVEVPTHRNF